MKLKTILIFLVILCIWPLTSDGQYIVRKADVNSTGTSRDGFYYALPQTVLKIDLTLEHIKKIPGPLADFAGDYLGVNDYIGYAGSAVNLLHAEIEPLYKADPDQYYYMQFPVEKSKDEKPTSIVLTSEGTLIGFGMEYDKNEEPYERDINQTFLMMENDDRFSYYADYNRTKLIDTVIRKISIDTVTINRFLFKTSWVDKTDREKAEEAARKISEIREARFHLMSGYQEVNYGESIQYMNRELKQMEQGYLELFLGKEVKTTDHLTLFYVPEKDKLRDVLYNDTNGHHIEIILQPGGSTDNLLVAPSETINSLYYRIPQSAVVSIAQDGNTFVATEIPVSQFGVTATVPLDRTRLLFDQTGNLKSIIRD